jgi:tetratricopeptide (TPR) repeat protein
MTLSKLGRVTEATRIFNQAIKLKPDNDAAEIALTLAAKAACLLAQDARNAQKALTLADKAIALDYRSPGDPSQAAFPFVIKAATLMTKAANEWKESMLEMFKTVVSGKAPVASKAMSKVMYGNMDELSQAVKVLGKALAINPDLELAWYMRGAALFSLGLEKEALDAFDKATKLKPDFWQAWGLKSVLLFLSGEIREAEHARIQASKYGGGKGDYASLGKFLEGVIAGVGARSRTKTTGLSESLRYDLTVKECIAYDLIGEYQRGLWSCEKAIAIDPNREEAWCFRGNIFRDKGEHQLAIYMYDRALEIDRNSLLAQYEKAYCLSILKRPQEALDLYDTIIKTTPDAGRAWEGRYYALIQLGRFKEAGTAYKKGAEFDPQIAEEIAMPF